MKVVILCGGRGTRLYEETEVKPKPLVQVGDRPILVHVMEIYARYGFESFILCLGHKGEMIRHFFLNFHAMTGDLTIDLKSGKVRTDGSRGCDWSVTLSDTGRETGTGGRIKRIAPLLDNDTFMLCYGDCLADLDLGKLLDFHKKKGRLATVTGVSETSRFGVIEADGNGIVSRFREKPILDGMISGGFFVLEPEVLRYIEDDGPFESLPLEKLANDGELAAYRHDGFFRGMDTYRDYLELNALIEGGTAPWLASP